MGISLENWDRRKLYNSIWKGWHMYFLSTKYTYGREVTCMVIYCIVIQIVSAINLKKIIIKKKMSQTMNILFIETFLQLMYLSGWDISISSWSLPCKKAVLTSSWSSSMSWTGVKGKITLIDACLTTRENTF